MSGGDHGAEGAPNFICKGCSKEIVAGQLRRGDEWHADCHAQARPNFDDKPKPRWSPPKGTKPSGLTETQWIILDAAVNSPTGSVLFGAGDRRGTRVAGFDSIGRPVIVAYASPEYFLYSRGLMEKTNERFAARITDAGRAKLAKKS